MILNIKIYRNKMTNTAKQNKNVKDSVIEFDFVNAEKNCSDSVEHPTEGKPEQAFWN